MLVFVDESGDSGIMQKVGSSKFFVITAVAFSKNEDAEACDKRISEIRWEWPVADFPLIDDF